MSDLKPLAPEVLLHIAQVLEVPMKGLVASIELLDEGGTVPFIARYRKEVTHSLDEEQLRNLNDLLGKLRALDERRRDLGLSKAQLARQAGMRPEVVRRILGAGPANPTLSTVISLANAMSMDVTISAPADRRQSDASETRRRTA